MVLFWRHGLIAYVFPVFFLSVLFCRVEQGQPGGNRKACGDDSVDLFLCMLIELLTKGSAVDGAAAAYSYSFEHRTGGGFIGGLLAWIFARISVWLVLSDRCDC